MASLRKSLRLCHSSRNAPAGLITSTWPLRALRKWQSTKQAPISQDSSQNGAAFHDLMSTLEEQYAEPFSEPSSINATENTHESTSPAGRPSRGKHIKPPEYKNTKTSSDTIRSKPIPGAVNESNSPNSADVTPSINIKKNFKQPSYVNNQVRIRTRSGESLFDPLFLRDACTCPKCVDPSTRQKLFSTTDIPADIRVKGLWTEGTSVNLVWSTDVPGFQEGHITSLPYTFLHRSINKHPVRSYRLGKSFWNAQRFEESQTVFDYNEYMSQDNVLFAALQQLHQYGMVFVKNVPEAEASVSDIATRIGPLKNTFYGNTWNVRSVAQAKNVAYTSQDLGFHMDLLYMHQPPRLQLLHCLKASSEGGTSLFSDSYLAANRLHTSSRHHFDALANNDVNFHYDNDSQHYHQSRRVIQLIPGADVPLKEGRSPTIAGVLEAINWSPPFQGPFHNIDGDNAMAAQIRDWHSAAQAFRDLVERKAAVYRRQMPPGECVIFDNRRVLHARTAFSGGERWLRGCYLDSDPFLSKMRVLERKFGHIGLSKPHGKGAVPA